MFICEACGIIFDEPDLLEYDEMQPDGFRERFRIPICPQCGSDNISKMEDDNE